jgi:glycosyltransferase involved in cell wall biosynthesis
VRILAITSSYPLFPGDSTAPFVESIVQSVAELGHDVDVLVPEHRRWRRPSSEGSVRYHRYRYSPTRSWTPWGFSESLEGGGKIKKPLYALAPAVLATAVRSARSLLTKNDFDIVHVHWVVPNGPIGALATRGTGVPLVVSVHGSDVALSERSRAAGRMTGWSFTRSTAVVAPSADLLERAQVLGAGGILERIPYGADADALSAPPAAAAALRARLRLGAEDIIVAGIGRLLRVKGFEFLVSAHARALDELPELRLVLVGDGDERASLEEQVRSLGVADSVRIVGAAARNEIPAYLAAADLVAVPSVRHEGYVDGLPNVALEALAAGRPLVATNVGGLPELVRPGVTGVLVAEKDSAALADAILELARDPVLRKRLGDEGRREIREERSWEAVGQRYVEVFEAAAFRGRGGTSHTSI